MAMRTYTFTFASGATGTNKFYVGPNAKLALVASAMTNWNAGAGNASMTIRAGLSESDTHADLASGNVLTATAKGVYPMTFGGLQYLSIGFGTAVTGGAANTLDLIVYEDAK